MPLYRADANPHRVAYGTTIGILLLNTRFPMIPGDVGNASTYPFPVLYGAIGSLPTDFWASGSAASRAPDVVEAARALQNAGVAAITSDCGYMAMYQREVQAALGIPVFLSSLLQVPFMQRTLPNNRRVGVIVADSQRMTEAILRNAGIEEPASLAIGGMEGQPAFCSAIIEENGSLDSDAIEREAVTVASDLVQRHPDIGALLLECSNLPPYASAIQDAVQLPVFDFNTMIRFVYSALTHTRYTGTYR
jgi:aspartate/glutamate racemase